MGGIGRNRKNALAPNTTNINPRRMRAMMVATFIVAPIFPRADVVSTAKFSRHSSISNLLAEPGSRFVDLDGIKIFDRLHWDK
jgi:hypothetical protein